MRIAVNVDGQFHGRMTGVQHYVDSLLTALYAVETPHEITAFAPTLYDPALLGRLREEGLFLWSRSARLRLDSAGSGALLAAQPGIASHRRLSHLARALDAGVLHTAKRLTWAVRLQSATRRYDLLHQPYPVPFQKWFRTRRRVATIYDLTTRFFRETHEPANIAVWEAFYAFARRRCDRILTISECSRRDIVEHLGIPEERIDVTPLAPRAATRPVKDPDALRAALEGLDPALGGGAPFALYAGTLEPRKNLERLIKAFALAIGEGRLPEHRLVLAGGDRESHGIALRQLAREQGIGERLIATGYVSNAQMNALMSACDAFAYVSLYEGFGLPPLEAMVCGAPVIAANASSLPEVVGDAGILVAPESVEEIASALHLLLTDRDENRRRRALSARRALLFGWERTAALTLKSYESAAA